MILLLLYAAGVWVWASVVGLMPYAWHKWKVGAMVCRFEDVLTWHYSVVVLCSQYIILSIIMLALYGRVSIAVLKRAILEC